MSTHRWTAADIPDQSGRTFVVTGANSGLGLEATKALARAGADVVMACRNTDKAEAARDGLAAAERAHTELLPLDLADLVSVRAAAKRLAGRDIAVLINNAGIMNTPFGRTAQGHELQFGTNVLGHFALTQALVGQISDRVVWLGSLMHRAGTLDLGDLDWQARRQKYNTVRAYGDTKLACIMLAYEQQRRFLREGSTKRAMAAHPGYSATNLQTNSGHFYVDAMMRVANRIPLLAQPPSRGALPELYAATVPDLPGGSYIGPGGLGETQGFPRPVGSSARSHDREAAAELWRRCEEMTADVPRT